ncbi:hypothetical protein KY314_02405 [Candidatus Woesearchaeota archaeon]|nr:hypothetical protein [Candidatus Woesearchaeota archaeon]
MVEEDYMKIDNSQSIAAWKQLRLYKVNTISDNKENIRYVLSYPNKISNYLTDQIRLKRSSFKNFSISSEEIENFDCPDESLDAFLEKSKKLPKSKKEPLILGEIE